MKLNNIRFPGFVKKRFYLPLISAIILAVSVIPYYLVITNFIFLVPLLFFIKDVKSGKDAIKGGIWFGIILYLTIFYWLLPLFKIQFFLGAFLYLTIIILFTIPITLLVFISYLIHRRWKFKFFLFMPFLWIIFEHLKTFGPFKFPGDHIANNMAIFPQFIQFVDITGPYGIGFWLILVNTLVFEAIVSYRKKSGWIKYITIAALFVILPVSYSLYKWKTLNFEPDLKVSVLQPNIPIMEKLKGSNKTENMSVVLSMTSEAIEQKPDIIIWPETSYPFPLIHRIDKDFGINMPEVSESARTSKIPILVGAEYARVKSKEDYDIYNAALLVDSNGNIKNYYGKKYLVPFTEAIPFREILGISRMGKQGLLARLGGFSSGEKFTIFSVERKTRETNKKVNIISEGKQENEVNKAIGINKEENKVEFGVLICYEGLFPELSRQFIKEGADFLVCITNDAWFGNTCIPFWHASALRMRAIENRVFIARSANTGVSCFLDSTGRMHHNTEVFTKTIITGLIDTSASLTIYAKYGDVIIFAAYPFILILLLFTAIFRKKHPK